jgi:transcriptional regulator with XRE-family HTH domain
MAYKRTFGRTISKLRNEKEWTQDKVAEMLGIPKPTYAGYENNFRRPQFETVVKLAEIFNTSTDYLMGVTNERKPQVIPNDLKKVLELKDFNYDGVPLSNDDLIFFNNMIKQYVRKGNS